MAESVTEDVRALRVRGMREMCVCIVCFFAGCVRLTGVCTVCVRERKKCGVCLFLSLLGRGCALRCVCGVCHTVVISTLSHTALRGFLHCGETCMASSPFHL